MSILDLRSEEPVSEPADANALEETPPGLDGIRAWIRKPRPWLRGVWLWIRWIATGLADGYRFLKKQAGPAAKRLHQIASEGERLSRAATRAGNAVREIGGGFARGARALGVSDTRIGRAGARLVRLGGTARRFGGRVTAGGGAAAEVFAGVGRLARSFRGNGKTGLGLVDPPEEREPKQPAAPKPRLDKPNSPRTPPVTPGVDGPQQRGSPVASQAPPRFPAPSPPPAGGEQAPSPAPSVRPGQDRLEGLPKVFVPRVNALRERPWRTVLWPLVFDICSWREWTTPAELARWLSMHRRSLVRRHLHPMTEEGLLEVRYPDQRSSPKQAYRARRKRAPVVGSGGAPHSDPDTPSTSV